MRECRLGVEIHHQNTVTIKRGRIRQVLGNDSFADTTLKVRNRYSHSPACRPLRQKAFTSKSQAPSQLIYLSQRKPSLPPIIFSRPLRKRRIFGQLLSQGVRRDIKHELANFPDREWSKHFLVSGRESSAADGSLLGQASFVHSLKVGVVTHGAALVISRMSSNNAILENCKT
jgi:hypothetical protein